MKYAVKFRDDHDVPIFLNQWSVAFKVTQENGRFHYIRDVAQICQDLNIGWAWWTWRGGKDGQKGGSSNMVYNDYNGNL